MLRWISFGILGGMLLFLVTNIFWSVESPETEGRFIPHMTALFIMGLSIVGLIIRFAYRATLPFYVRILFCWAILVIFNLLLRGDFDSSVVAGRMMLWSLVGAYFYYIGLNSNLAPKTIKRFAALTIALVSIRIIYLLWLTGFTISRADFGFREVMNKNSFLLIWTCPMCHYGLATTFYKLMFLISCSVAVLTLKRAVILGLGFGLLIYALGMRTYKRGFRNILGTRPKKWGISFRILLFSLLVVICLSVVLAFRWEAFSDRISIDAKYGIAHGREVFWPILSKKIAESTLFEWIFGRGVFKVPDFLDSAFGAPVHAHNEWLEVVYDFGILGLFVLISLHICILSQVLRLVRERQYNIGIPMAMIYATILTSGFFGTYFHRTFYAWAFVFISYAIGQGDQFRFSRKKKRFNSKIIQ